MSAVRSLASRVGKLEQARKPSVYAAMWSGLADEMQAQIDAGICTDTDQPDIVASLRRWVRDGADSLWQRQGQ
ncbi:MAG TPA: hypothetical protein VE309_08510 [Caulobacteraceae bacterium]|nr:hypothetical protein [Caulobacteraceae bacterium]